MEEKRKNDGEAISDFLRDMSTKARALGRSIVFSIIAASWSLSFIQNKFVPSFYIKWSLALALIYLFLDLFFYFLMTLVYKYILVNYFDSDPQGGFKYKKGKDATNCTYRWMVFGFVWLILMLLLLLLSSFFIIMHVIQLEIPN